MMTFRIFTFDQRCTQAMQQVRRLYLSKPEWEKDVREGKTFGVLVWEGGYLAAFSGTLGGKTIQPGFVPPVFDLQHPGSYFLQEEAVISAINRRLASEQVTPREICELRHERKIRSHALQQWLFSQYIFLNIKGGQATLAQLFGNVRIPSGAGDCCAPKLLQEAFRRGIRPLAVAEWNSRDDSFTPPCTTRCRPILMHMLDGMEYEPDPRMTAYMAVADKMQTLYSDEHILVVNKPSGLLSVPGREFYPSVQSITGCLPAHRLDQDTSGIMLLARDAATLANLQRQFEHRTVHKQYQALLQHEMQAGSEGEITLPLRPDFDNLPHQVADPVHGRRAHTHYTVKENINGHAHLILTPHTGRTHQLRVHCAHPQGLDNPILGDRLYGIPDAQLMLHASYLEFQHPVSGETTKISCIPEWSAHQG